MATTLTIDFLSAKMRYRLAQAKFKRELLVKAIGSSPTKTEPIVDATAGLGRDSLLLASLGFHIIMLECLPAVHALLATALSQAKQDPMIQPMISRMQLIQANAIQWLKERPLHQRPAIVYLDPMFPPRRKAALVKKDMRLLQAYTTDYPESHENNALCEAALACATKRVIVKRPRLAPLLAARHPTFTLVGRHSRFEVYVCCDLYSSPCKVAARLNAGEPKSIE